MASAFAEAGRQLGLAQSLGLTSLNYHHYLPSQLVFRRQFAVRLGGFLIAEQFLLYRFPSAGFLPRHVSSPCQQHKVGMHAYFRANWDFCIKAPF